MAITFIVEIAVELKDIGQLDEIVEFLQDFNVPFYVKPARKNPCATLDEVEAECEGK